MCTQEPENEEGELNLCTFEPEQPDDATVNPELPEEKREQLKSLIQDLGETLDDWPGRTMIATYRIRTGDASPVHQHPYGIPAAWQSAVREEIQTMLNLVIIEPSDSPWASPIVTVRKNFDSV